MHPTLPSPIRRMLPSRRYARACGLRQATQQADMLPPHAENRGGLSRCCGCCARRGVADARAASRRSHPRTGIWFKLRLARARDTHTGDLTIMAITDTVKLEINGSAQKVCMCAERTGLPPLLIVQAGPGLPLLHEVRK